MSTNYPVTYEKGDSRRLAHSPADATKLRFSGFKPVTTEVSYDDLRDEAKLLGIPAKGTKAELAKAVDEAREGVKADDVEPANEGDKSVDTVGTPSDAPTSTEPF